MATKAHLEGNKRYLEKLENILIRVPRGKKEIIQAYAQKKGKSVNALVVELLEQEIGENLK